MAEDKRYGSTEGMLSDKEHTARNIKELDEARKRPDAKKREQLDKFIEWTREEVKKKIDDGQPPREVQLWQAKVVAAKKKELGF
jgi:hypothetical protein